MFEIFKTFKTPNKSSTIKPRSIRIEADSCFARHVPHRRCPLLRAAAAFAPAACALAALPTSADF
jgi:hypothetical protein